MMRDRASIDRLGASRLPGRDQPASELVTAVARFDHAAVEPQHIGHRYEQQPRHHPFEQVHREGVIALPIIAHHGIESGDQRPGRPQTGDLGQADVDRLAPRAAQRPVDAGRRITMHLVDEQRPQHHRHAAGKNAGDRRIGAVHRPALSPVDAQIGGDFGRVTRD